MFIFLSCVAFAGEITVAAAADLQFALRQIAHDYEAKTGNTVKLTFGSSGSLAAQIHNGAPFDVFFSADASYPDALIKAKAANGATLTRYAMGVLVVWIAGEHFSKTVPSVVLTNLDALKQPAIVRIAIANPQHAPYGRAAVEALKRAGIYDQLAPKLIIGETVTQAVQFVESGNASAALIPLALVGIPELQQRGDYRRISQSLYAPILQAAVVTARARDANLARDFLRYVTTTGMNVLTNNGFERVPAGARP